MPHDGAPDRPDGRDREHQLDPDPVTSHDQLPAALEALKAVLARVRDKYGDEAVPGMLECVRDKLGDEMLPLVDPLPPKVDPPPRRVMGILDFPPPGRRGGRGRPRKSSDEQLLSQMAVLIVAPHRVKRTPAAHAVLKRAGMPEGETRDNRARVLVRKFNVGQEKRIAEAKDFREWFSKFARIAGEQVCRDPLGENVRRALARVIDLRGSSAVVEQFVAGQRPLLAAHAAVVEQFVAGQRPLFAAHAAVVEQFVAAARRVIRAAAEQGASQESAPASADEELK
jgi:hypothetical protein